MMAFFSWKQLELLFPRSLFWVLVLFQDSHLVKEENKLEEKNRWSEKRFSSLMSKQRNLKKKNNRPEFEVNSILEMVFDLRREVC